MKPLGEALRYLGCEHEEDEAVIALLEEMFLLLEEVAAFRCTHRILDLTVDGSGITLEGDYRIKSRDLAHHLRGADRVLLLAATLGAGLDRALARQSAWALAEAAALDACASALLEQACDSWQTRLADTLNRQGFRGKLGSRFSPGYGDFSLNHQPKLLQRLDAARQIGLSCTGRAMLTPTKSITALVGLGGESTEKTGCGACPACQRLACPQRKDGQAWTPS